MIWIRNKIDEGIRDRKIDADIIGLLDCPLCNQNLIFVKKEGVDKVGGGMDVSHQNNSRDIEVR